MSSPQQTVYFYNPTTITNLQTNVTQLQQNANMGQTINASVATPLVAEYMESIRAKPTWGGSGLGPLGGHKGCFFYGGNIYSGQEIFTSTGVANSAGLQYSLDTIINPASQGKAFIGMTLAKMMEERIIYSSDKASTFWPQVMTGTAPYWSSFTLLNSTNFPYDSSSWTGTTATYNLANITIQDLVQLQMPILDDGLSAPPLGFQGISSARSSVITAYNLACQQLGTGSADFSGLAHLVLTTKYAENAINNVNCPPTISYLLGYTGTANQETITSEMLRLHKTGVFVGIFKPADYANLRYPFDSRGHRIIYDFSYQVLLIVLDKCLKAYNGGATYPNGWVQYAREKFFTPLGMNDTYVMGAENVPDEKKSRVVELAWRRAPSFQACYASYGPPTDPLFPNNYINLPQPVVVTNIAASGASYSSVGCSPAYAAASKAIFNLYTGTSSLQAYADPGLLAWASEYPDDSLSRQMFTIYNLTGTNGNVFGPCPLLTTPRDWGKVIRLLCKRGYDDNGNRLLKPESWNWLMSPKINAVEYRESIGNSYSAVTSTYNNQNNPNRKYSMGLSRIPTDLSNLVEYGLDDQTVLTSGATAVLSIFDLSTGNWFFEGTQELGSTGNVEVRPYNLGSTFTRATFVAPDLIARLTA